MMLVQDWKEHKGPFLFYQLKCYDNFLPNGGRVYCLPPLPQIKDWFQWIKGGNKNEELSLPFPTVNTSAGQTCLF